MRILISLAVLLAIPPLSRVAWSAEPASQPTATATAPAGAKTAASGPTKLAKTQRAAKSSVLVLKLSNLTPATKSAALKKVQRAVGRVKGVARVVVNRKRGEIRVVHSAGADVAAVRKAVSGAGFTVVDPRPVERTDAAARPSAPPAAPAAAPAAPSAPPPPDGDE